MIRKISPWLYRYQHFNPIHCIIPPYMAESIIKKGDDELKTWAINTLMVSEEFRGRRRAIGSLAALAIPAGGKRRTVYDARNSEELPGVVVRREGEPRTGDDAVNEAYDGAGATYDLYYEEYGRNSIDDKGMSLDSTVHFGEKYDNAFWNGTQMVYGDGDGRLFNRFTIALDVIGHELTHGVTQHEANLLYQGEPGALNESFSDVFGILTKQRILKQNADKADWIIGAGLFTKNVKGAGIRSMKEPGKAYDDPVLGKDPQPDHYDNLYKGSADNGGVHINSGIPNRAFYLAAMEIGGFAWAQAGKIWYHTLIDHLGSRADFKRAAQAFERVAGELYGEKSIEQKAVKSGWKQVGVI
ncbi:MAG: peptidase M4 [Spirochaetes bacterium RBG_16_49_21]|nr:MAG: peptidase M4 [Spirochaetes bacterium RBG_16_49_21]